jgi:hypothetical protein
MIACNSAPGCDSFSYNPTMKRCFLKAGGSQQTCGSAPTVCVSARGQPYSCGVWQTYSKQGQPATAAAAGGPSRGGSSARLAQAFSRP